MDNITKQCKKCGEIKSITEFHKAKGCKYGVRNICKSCINARMKIYRANPMVKQKNQQWSLDHPYRRWAISSISSHRYHRFIVNISIDELENLAEKTTHCQYCGKLLNWDLQNKGRQLHDSPTLDRINNEPTLSLDNTKIICYFCNRAKMNLNFNEFIQWISSIYKNQCQKDG